MKSTEKGKNGFKLSMDVLGTTIKAVRQKRNLTQTQLGELVGVKKAQISKLESGLNSATIDTICKVFNALKTEISFKVASEKQIAKPTTSTSQKPKTKKAYASREYRDMDID